MLALMLALTFYKPRRAFFVVYKGIYPKTI